MNVNNDNQWMIDALFKAGFGGDEIKRLLGSVVAKVNGEALREVVSKLTEGEAGELARKLGEVLKQACDSSVNKPDFQKIGMDVALEAWKIELGKLDQSVVEKLKGPLDEYLKTHQEEAKKIGALISR